LSSKKEGALPWRAKRGEKPAGSFEKRGGRIQQKHRNPFAFRKRKDSSIREKSGRGERKVERSG